MRSDPMSERRTTAGFGITQNLHPVKATVTSTTMGRSSERIDWPTYWRQAMGFHVALKSAIVATTEYVSDLHICSWAPAPTICEMLH